MLPAELEDLKRSFRHHTQVEGAASESRNLLLFYAVECGLKAVWMRRNHLTRTDQIENPIIHTHDLRRLAAELTVATGVGQCQETFKLRRDSAGWQARQVHEAWRYGVQVDPKDEQALVDWLARLWSWAREELAT
jgi:hypothetical protein